MTMEKKNKSEFSVLSFTTLCRGAKCGQSRMQMNGGKQVMQPETDVGSEVPLTSFDVAHPDLNELSKLICSKTDFTEQQRLSETA